MPLAKAKQIQNFSIDITLTIGYNPHRWDRWLCLAALGGESMSAPACLSLCPTPLAPRHAPACLDARVVDDARVSIITSHRPRRTAPFLAQSNPFLTLPLHATGCAVFCEKPCFQFKNRAQPRARTNKHLADAPYSARRISNPFAIFGRGLHITILHLLVFLARSSYGYRRACASPLRIPLCLSCVFVSFAS